MILLTKYYILEFTNFFSLHINQWRIFLKKFYHKIHSSRWPGVFRKWFATTVTTHSQLALGQMPGNASSNQATFCVSRFPKRFSETFSARCWILDFFFPKFQYFDFPSFHFRDLYSNLSLKIPFGTYTHICMEMEVLTYKTWLRYLLRDVKIEPETQQTILNQL